MRKSGEDFKRSILPTMENFDKAKQKSSGGGTWRDSRGRDGTFTSAISTRIMKARDCRSSHKFTAMVGCYENMSFYRYTIELDDGRTEWFSWKSKLFGNPFASPSSSSGFINMKFLEGTRPADGEQGHAITIVDGDYALTLVEEKIAEVPNSITYIPRSRLQPPTPQEQERLHKLLNQRY